MTEPAVTNPWSEYDAARFAKPAGGERPMRFIFYGRMSTGNQHEKTSHEWQLEAARNLIARVNGEIVDTYFDAEVSRSIPWQQRPEGSKILTELGNPRRGFEAMVIGESQRMFYGSQFAEILPLFERAGVPVWIPELGGAYDAKNDANHLQMAIFGSLSRSERQKAKSRVKAAMAVQARTEGRFQGGRAPHGYRLVDIGAHPNPSEAARGVRQRQLVVDPETAPDVARIFDRYLAGDSMRKIAGDLNADGIPCPSARDSLAAGHRHADGWQASTIESILSRERYTGYAVFGERERVEVAISDNPADGYHIRRPRSTSAPTRSATIAFAAIVPVEKFHQVQALRKKRASTRVGDRSGAEHAKRRPVESPYLFRGLIRCSICGRRLESWRRDPVHDKRFYRCVSKDLVPGSPIADAHPKHLRIAEDDVRAFVDGWLGELFSPENLGSTVDAMLGTRGREDAVARKRETKLRAEISSSVVRKDRLYKAIALGANPGEILEQIAEIDAEVAEAQTLLAEYAAVVPAMDAGELRRNIEAMADVVREVLGAGDAAQLQELYAGLGLAMEFDVESKTLDIEMLSSPPTASIEACGKRTCRWWDSNPH